MDTNLQAQEKEIDNQDTTEQNKNYFDEDALRLFKIHVYDPNNKKYTLEIPASDYALEIKQYLADILQTCYYTNYHLELADGSKINEYIEIGENPSIQDGVELYMKPDMYDEKSVRAHLRRIKEIFVLPPVMSSHPSIIGVEENTEVNEENKNEKQEQAQSSNNPLGQKDMEKQFKEFLDTLEKSGNKKDFNIKVPNIDSLEDIFSSTIHNQLKKFKAVKCIEYITLSAFNPVPSNRKLEGDLMYLRLKTIEGYEYCITCNMTGFFINGSQENGQFDPNPSKRVSPCFSHTLIGLLAQISASFKKNFEKHLKLAAETEPLLMVKSPQQQYSWIYDKNADKDENNTNNIYSNLNKFEDVAAGLYGIDPRGYRDWNEEFQVCKTLGKEHVLQRVQRDRAFYKIYYEFVDAAVAGAKAVIDKNIQALNPMDAEKQQVFVYNQIFFSFAIDLSDSFKETIGPENNPTYIASNLDLLSLKTVHNLDIEGLHILATCLINYKGCRIIAQSIIPGILSNTDHHTATEYGSIDEGKTICHTPEFVQMMTELAERLSINESKIADQNNEIHTIAGSPDMKGIRGTDRRKYVLDLVRLSPRDANYKDEESSGCLIRPELMIIYQRTKSIEYATEKVKEYEKNIKKEENKEEKKEVNKKVEDMTEEEKKKDKERRAQEAENTLKRINVFQTALKEAPQIKFNINVYTNTKLEASKEEKTEAESKVEELAQFLKDIAIPKLVKDLHSVENVPIDSFTLQEALHSHGINIRYLGAIFKQLKSEQSPHLRHLIERDIIMRTCKHILNELIRESPLPYTTSIITHFFNCLLSAEPFIELLDKREVKFEDKTKSKEMYEALFKSESETQSQLNRKEEEDEKESSSKKEGKSKKKNKKKHEENTIKVDDDSSISQSKKKKKNKNKGSTSQSANKIVSRQEENKENKLEKQIDINITPLPSILRIQIPTSLKITPAELWTRIRELANIRYSHNLPALQTEVKMLQVRSNKIALLRDLCLRVGIQLENKNYKNLDKNDLSKKELFVYADLPFQSSDIHEIFPIVKHMDIKNADVIKTLDDGKKAFVDGRIDQAFDMFNQCIQLQNLVSGPLNKEAAACFSKLANIHFRLADFNNAIKCQQRALILNEKILGIDHPQTAHSYSNLALFYHGCGDMRNAFDYMYRALYLLSIAGGHNVLTNLSILKHPDIASIYLNLGLMYQDIEQHQSAIESFFESLYRYIELFGKIHMQVAGCYQAIALAHYHIQDFRQALQYQEECHKILVELLPVGDSYIANSKNTLDQYTSLCVQAEKNNQNSKKMPGIYRELKDTGQRGFGKNKSQQQQQQQQIQQQQLKQFQQQQLQQLQQQQLLQNVTASQESMMQELANAGMNISKQKGGKVKASNLIQRMQNPKQRNILDVLEYNYLKNLYAQKAESEKTGGATKEKTEERVDEKKK